MKLEVLNINGQATGKEIELSDDIFGIEPNDHAIYLAVKQYLAHQRQGTHKAKERGEIKGSTRKIKRQKGTGTARAGSIKNPLFRGGGRVFGPRPRNYGIKLNKKVKTLARSSALTQKAQNGSIIIVEDLNLDTPKTKTYVEMLKNLGVESKKTLLLVNGDNLNVYKSAKNLQKANVMPASLLNTYSILNAETLIISESTATSFS
ncbi:MAG: 50S ribosomal protein L4 [Chitinophagales bacterium]